MNAETLERIRTDFVAALSTFPFIKVVEATGDWPVVIIGGRELSEPWGVRLPQEQEIEWDLRAVEQELKYPEAHLKDLWEARRDRYRKLLASREVYAIEYLPFGSEVIRRKKGDGEGPLVGTQFWVSLDPRFVVHESGYGCHLPQLTPPLRVVDPQVRSRLRKLQENLGVV